MTEYVYFPGCSQKATARGYEESLKAVAPRLGITLKELPDWSCCGTSLVLSVNKTLSYALAARNLALAESQGTTLVTPCPSCKLTLAKANHLLQDGGELAGNVTSCLDAAGLKYQGNVKVRHLLDVIVNDIGVDKIRQEVKAPLKGKRIAPYYGCQVVRPVADGDDADVPQNLEKVIAALGGEPADFAMKTACCGGALVATKADVGAEMCKEILESIARTKAEIIVTPCPLCQVTLEMAQSQQKKALDAVPILNLTQLMGVAFGLSDKELGLQRALQPAACRRAFAPQPSLTP